MMAEAEATSAEEEEEGGTAGASKNSKHERRGFCMTTGIDKRSCIYHDI